MGSDLPRLLHPDSDPAPPRRSVITLPPLSQLNPQPPPPASSSSSSSSSSQSQPFAPSAAASRAPALTPPPSSTLNSPPPPSSAPNAPWTAVNQNHSVSSPGDRRNGSHPSRLPSAHLAQPQHPVSSQPIPSPADSTRPQVEQNKPCPKQFRGASISYILSSASPSTTANSDIVARPRTPPPSVLSPPLLAQTKESDLQSHRPYNTPPSPAQTPKANTQSDSHSRARSVHFPPGANGIIRMPPPRSPQRHHSTGPEGLVTYSCESASAGDSSTPRHSSTDSDDRGSSAPPLTYMEPVTVPSSDCNTCRLRADAKLEQINSMNAAYKAQTKNGEKRDLSDMASLVQAIQRNNHQYVQESERCPECHQPPPPPVRNNYLGESSPRPNKRKSPSCVSSEPEETCSKARRTTPDESLSRDAEEAFGLLPTLAGSRHTWTPRQGPQRPVPGVEAD